eukprot:TRINITY_DN20509_c0_g1_i1.p1 TRINITY_DN20509_c0_g1~~TRINITY_DN20509_c0_g1_i1.p1  ORF type:complete len:411 (-),score=90.95 TRINITY_DN20509_c0_g1_i1:26-1258(-)
MSKVRKRKGSISGERGGLFSRSQERPTSKRKRKPKFSTLKMKSKGSEKEQYGYSSTHMTPTSLTSRDHDQQTSRYALMNETQGTKKLSSSRKKKKSKKEKKKLKHSARKEKKKEKRKSGNQADANTKNAKSSKQTTTNVFNAKNLKLKSSTSNRKANLEQMEKLLEDGDLLSKYSTGGGEQSWECAACTFHNLISSITCEMCSTPNPTRRAVEAPSKRSMYSVIPASKRGMQYAALPSPLDSEKWKRTDDPLAGEVHDTKPKNPHYVDIGDDKAKPTTSAIAPASWWCSICTYQNIPSVTTCAMCNQKKAKDAISVSIPMDQSDSIPQTEMYANLYTSLADSNKDTTVLVPVPDPSRDQLLFSAEDLMDSGEEFSEDMFDDDEIKDKSNQEISEAEQQEQEGQEKKQRHK